MDLGGVSSEGTANLAGMRYDHRLPLAAIGGLRSVGGIQRCPSRGRTYTNKTKESHAIYQDHLDQNR